MNDILYLYDSDRYCSYYDFTDSDKGTLLYTAIFMACDEKHIVVVNGNCDDSDDIKKIERLATNNLDENDFFPNESDKDDFMLVGLTVYG